ncbi:hypothetical protein Tco_1218010 [Tanacetum coccineum]
MHEKFQRSSMGELTFYLGLRSKVRRRMAIDSSQDNYVVEIIKEILVYRMSRLSKHNQWKVKSLQFKDEDEKKYQVNPKVSHLHVVKRIRERGESEEKQRKVLDYDGKAV